MASMDVENYLRSILKKYSISADLNRLIAIGNAEKSVRVVITEWAHTFLHEIKRSGSIEKGTAISTSADLDLFISLKSETPGSLPELYEGLAKWLESKNYKIRRQNSSIRINHAGINVDLIPARKFASQSGSLPGLLGQSQDHSIRIRKSNSWAKTNIEAQIRKVKDSRRHDDIKLAKIWRDISGIDFPSIYLELSVIKALNGDALGLLLPPPISKRFVTFMNYLVNDFETATIEDPGNKSNKISDDLSTVEKKVIINAAKNVLTKNWTQVLW